jgi:hypothetical protein
VQANDQELWNWISQLGTLLQNGEVTVTLEEPMPQASPPPQNPPCKAPSCEQTSYGVSIGHYFCMPGAAVQGLALWPKKKNPKYVQMAECTKQSIQGLSRYGLPLLICPRHLSPSCKEIHSQYKQPTDTYVSMAWLGYMTNSTEHVCDQMFPRFRIPQPFCAPLLSSSNLVLWCNTVKSMRA